MGNALTFLYGKCCKPTTTDDSLGPHGVSAATVGVSALAHDLFNFEITSQVPEGLGRYVQSSRKAQANWYRKILEAWKQAKPPPQTAEEASRLVIEILKRNQKADVEVDPKAVADGDTITVYVSTSEPVVSSSVPREVNLAAVQRAKAREKRNYPKADELHQKIIDSGYRVLNIENEEVLARKFRIRLRGIDAPESQMPFGKEAQQGLLKIVGRKSLKVLVYGEDQYGRCVGDLYCNGIFVQEAMLKKGLAWHYFAYDKRPVLAKARLVEFVLYILQISFVCWHSDFEYLCEINQWASSNPEKPWDWRKNNRRE
ncbi:unnamed protein product [Arabidopsis arenosa]|uniref:TNase-like domain-containing protein n=1 Tax=Arabidopsis arenosa TaxID=38785 RepID=A0A8S2AA52_ARAAE|nr:unnamed protein product [Arabidopsis arenosa]